LGDSLKDKLDSALGESSHFLIILSEASVKSDWVKIELKEALSLFNQNTLRKIIPVKYRSCVAPVELGDLIYGDLSEEIVKIENDKLTFLSEGYNLFLVKLIKTLNSNDRQLNKTDRTTILSDAKQIEINIEKRFETNLNVSHEVIGFNDNESVKKYREIVSSVLPAHGPMRIYPVVLPSMYKKLLHNPKKGDKLKSKSRKEKSITGFVAGFRDSQTYLVIPQAIREFLEVTIHQTCNLVNNVFSESGQATIEASPGEWLKATAGPELQTN
jgi:hypothetical protein